MFRPVTVVVALLASAVWPIARAQRVRPARRNEPEFARVEVLAQSVGPAFGSDALLRMSGIDADRVSQRRAIEEAFTRAATVQPEFPLVPVPVGFTDSVPAMAAISSRLGVDRLSLQTRAVEAMAAIDPQRARRMFESITIPAPPVATCQELTVPDPKSYYTAMTGVAGAAFERSKKGAAARDEFVLAHLDGIVSAGQVLPAARVLAEAGLSAAALERGLTSLGNAVRGLERDDRAFTLLVLGEEDGTELDALDRACRTAGVSTAVFLQSMYRFLASNLAAERCSDTGTDAQLRERQSNALRRFDSLAQAVLPSYRPLLLAPVDRKYETAAAADDLWTGDAQYRGFVQRIEKIGDMPEGVERDNELRQTASDVAEWAKPLNTSERAYFQVKCGVFYRLLRTAGSQRGAEGVADAYVAFLSASHGEENDYPAEWLWQVDQLLRMARDHPLVTETVRGDMERSSDGTLALEAALDRMLAARVRDGTK